MFTAVARRLKALSPLQLTLVIIAAFALVGASTATAKSLITGSDIQDRSIHGRDIARSTVTHANIKKDTVLSQNIPDGAVQSKDLSPGVRSRLSSGAQGSAGKDGAAGPAGPAGAAGAPGAFLVKDANGTVAGTLLAVGAVSGRTYTFDFRGHTFGADAETGALSIQQEFYYESTDCSGTPHVTSQVYPGQTAVSTENPAGPGPYTYGDRVSPPTMHSYGSYGMGISVCGSYTFTPASAIAMVALPDGDVPPALTGPLRYPPAG